MGLGLNVLMRKEERRIVKEWRRWVERIGKGEGARTSAVVRAVRSSD